jgi:hypothetical protein
MNGRVLQSVVRQGTIRARIFSEQLENLKIITVGGGLDEPLSAAATTTRKNFKAAKDKKG